MATSVVTKAKKEEEKEVGEDTKTDFCLASKRVFHGFKPLRKEIQILTMTVVRGKVELLTWINSRNIYRTPERKKLCSDMAFSVDKILESWDIIELPWLMRMGVSTDW